MQGLEDIGKIHLEKPRRAFLRPDPPKMEALHVESELSPSVQLSHCERTCWRRSALARWTQTPPISLGAQRAAWAMVKMTGRSQNLVPGAIFNRFLQAFTRFWFSGAFGFAQCHVSSERLQHTDHTSFQLPHLLNRVQASGRPHDCIQLYRAHTSYVWVMKGTFCIFRCSSFLLGVGCDLQ